MVRFVFLSKFPLSIKLILIIALAVLSIFINLYLFVQHAPFANTGSYNTTTKSKANFITIKEDHRRVSFQLINKGKKRKKVDQDRLTVFFFHGFPGSRHFHHADELTILKENFNTTQIVRFDRPGLGYTLFPTAESANTPQRRGKPFTRFEVVLKDATRLVKSMKLKREKIGVVGFGTGSPYALLFSKTLAAPLALISPIGKIFQEPAKKKLYDDTSPFFRWYEGMRRHWMNQYLPFTTFQSFWIRLWSQLGVVCSSEYWYSIFCDKLGVLENEELEKIFFVPQYSEAVMDDLRRRIELGKNEKEEDAKEEEDDEEEIEIDEDWGNMLNDSFVEMFRQGVMGGIEEIEVLFSDHWNKMDLTKYKKVKKKCCDSDKFSKIKIFRGLKDQFVSKRSVDDLIQELGRIEDLELEVEELENGSHFSTFKDRFENALDFVISELE